MSQAAVLYCVADSRQHQLPPAQSCQDFNPALDAKALKDAGQMLFHCAFRQAEHLRNALVGKPPQNQGQNFALPGR
jgi:hypothetical protein